MKYIKLLSILIICLVGIGGCNQAVETNQESKAIEEVRESENKSIESQKDNGEETSRDTVGMKEPKEQELSKEEKEAMVIEESLQGMSLEEKVGQLFMVAYRGEGVTTIQETMIKDLETYYPGGIILFGENIQSPDQTKTFITSLQEESKYPLFIGVDEEGGLVSRITNNPDMGYEALAPMGTIGEAGDLSKGREVGSYLGMTLKELGFNLDFAPVGDINTNPLNPVIGNRAFGQEPHIVSDMVSEVIIGLQENGVSASVKHFPGHGDTLADSHKGQVQVEHNIERLRQVEWLPFEEAIKVGVDTVMVGHINTPNATSDGLPASLSKEMITTYLRGELGYNGIVITDALEMGAISNYYSSAEACITAIKAGVDILLMPLDWKEGYDGVMNAVNQGDIKIETIDDAVRRVLSIKVKRGLLEI